MLLFLIYILHFASVTLSHREPLACPGCCASKHCQDTGVAVVRYSLLMWDQEVTFPLCLSETYIDFNRWNVLAFSFLALGASYWCEGLVIVTVPWRAAMLYAVLSKASQK